MVGEEDWKSLYRDESSKSKFNSGLAIVQMFMDDLQKANIYAAQGNGRGWHSELMKIYRLLIAKVRADGDDKQNQKFEGLRKECSKQLAKCNGDPMGRAMTPELYDALQEFQIDLCVYAHHAGLYILERGNDTDIL